MEEGVIEKILEEINQSIQVNEQDSLGFGEPDCIPLAFSADNFHSMPLQAVSDSKMIFIDGGNAEILSSPGFCVHFVRVFHTIYEDNVRVSCSSDEFYVLASAKNMDGKIFYSAKLFKSRSATLTDSFFATDFLFDSLDKDLCEGSSRLDISRIPGVIRRLAELSTALLLANPLNKNNILVLDGDLSAKIPDERKLIAALKNIAKKNDVFVCALSKTSNLLTANANSALIVLNKLAPFDSWYYYPVVEAPNSIYFTKLHPSSGYVFKLEAFDLDADSVFPLLAANSKDPVFLGYPYGLVEADRFARVSNREKEYLKTILMSKAGKEWDLLDTASKALDAHSVLDNIS